jgi:hypothetical protein
MRYPIKLKKLDNTIVLAYPIFMRTAIYTRLYEQSCRAFHPMSLEKFCKLMSTYLTLRARERTGILG